MTEAKPQAGEPVCECHLHENQVCDVCQYPAAQPEPEGERQEVGCNNWPCQLPRGHRGPCSSYEPEVRCKWCKEKLILDNGVYVHDNTWKSNCELCAEPSSSSTDTERVPKSLWPKWCEEGDHPYFATDIDPAKSKCIICHMTEELDRAEAEITQLKAKLAEAERKGGSLAGTGGTGAGGSFGLIF